MMIQTIALKEIKFYALHGFYPEERLIGNHFSVDVEVTFHAHHKDSEEIANTVNYEVINEVVSFQMTQTKKMLETVVKNIIDELIKRHPFLLTATVGIKKLSPSMPGEIGYSYVALNYVADSLRSK